MPSSGSALSAPDSIMEPGVLAALKSFISSDSGAISQPERVKEAIRQLSESYQGRAQICNLLGRWSTEILADPQQEISEIVMNHFKELAMQQFDITKADSIFSAPAKGEPEWLSFMIRDATWRSVLYALSQDYPNCLLLNFAIRKISEEGHGNELPVTSRPGDMTFDTFRQVFRDSLLLALSRSEPDQFQSAVQELQRTCCQTEHAYLFAQMILLALSLHPTQGTIFQNLAQAISAHADDLHGSRVRSLNLLLTQAPKYPELFSALNALAKGSRLTTVDVKNLYALYSGNDPPPVALLRHSSIYVPLIEALLDYNRPPLEPVANQYTVSLLAYASCVRDHRLWYSSHSTTSASIEDQLVDKSKMNATIAALNDISSICRNKDFGFNIVQNESALRAYLVIPICAAAVLHWIQLSLLSPAYYTTTYQSVCTPVLIRLLGIISTLHRLQRVPVFELLVQIFNLKTDLNDLAVIRFRKMVLQVLIHLVHHGLLVEVTDMVKENAPRMDHSLVRFFITELLLSVGPPYSPVFAQQVFAIIAMPDATLAIRNDPVSVVQVSRFAARVHELNIAELGHQCDQWTTEKPSVE